MALSVEIKYDPKFFDTLNKELKSDVPRTLRFFGALFERRSKAEARKHTHGGRFWASIANSIVTDATKDSVSVGATHFAASHKHTGGTISAPGNRPGSRNSQNLTIPIDDEAKGKNVSDFRKQDLLFLKSRKGNKIIFKKLSNGDIKPLYVLKKAVDQRPEPWFPYEKADLDINKAVNESLRILRDAK